MRQVGLIPGSTTLTALVLFAASPVQAWSGDDIGGVDGAALQTVAAPTDELLNQIEVARYNPYVLDGGFFARLSNEAPDSTARATFEGSLQQIDWYQVPTARKYVRANYPESYDRFLDRSGIAVAVVAPGEPILAAEVAAGLVDSLPEYAHLATSPGEADVILLIEELAYEPTRTATRQPRSKPYRGKYRTSPVASERLVRANYTRVHEVVSLSYQYRITVRDRAGIVSQRVLRERAERAFSYGENLVVYTEAGVLEETPDHLPTRTMRRMTDRDAAAEHAAAMEKLHGHVVDRIGDALARVELPYRRASTVERRTMR